MSAGDTPIIMTGNRVEDPALRFTQQGQPVASFSVASVPRYLDKATNEWRDGDGLFLTVNVWKQQAENVCESLAKGTRVVVTGRLRQRTWTRGGRGIAMLRHRSDPAIRARSRRAGGGPALGGSDAGPPPVPATRSKTRRPQAGVPDGPRLRP